MAEDEEQTHGLPLNSNQVSTEYTPAGMPKCLSRVRSSPENRDGVRISPVNRDRVRVSAEFSDESSGFAGFSARSSYAWIRTAGVQGFYFGHGFGSVQGVSRVRFSSTATGNRLEDELGNLNVPNTQAVAGNAEAFSIADADTVGNLVTPQAQAISEVSAVIGDCSYPTAFLQLLIESVHVHAGLPWWAAISVTTIGIRILCLPVIVYQLRSAAKLSLMRPEMEKINAEIKDSGYDPRVSAEGRERIMALFTKYKTTPFSPFVGAILQAPVFMCFFFAVRNMAARVESFKDGGFLWFTDLSTPDSTYILPAVTCLGVLLTVELNAAEGMEGNPLADKMKKFMRIFAAVLFPLSMSFEKALFCYWITSNFWALLQSTILKRPAVKNYMRIPETAHLTAKPEPALAVTPAEPIHRPTRPVGRKKLKGSRRK